MISRGLSYAHEQTNPSPDSYLVSGLRYPTASGPLDSRHLWLPGPTPPRLYVPIHPRAQLTITMTSLPRNMTLKHQFFPFQCFKIFQLFSVWAVLTTVIIFPHPTCHPLCFQSIIFTTQIIKKFPYLYGFFTLLDRQSAIPPLPLHQKHHL